MDDAFVQMAQAAIKREQENQLFMPDKIGGIAPGGMKLGKDDKKKGKT